MCIISETSYLRTQVLKTEETYQRGRQQCPTFLTAERLQTSLVGKSEVKNMNKDEKNNSSRAKDE
jgi:hypothetical protein